MDVVRSGDSLDAMAVGPDGALYVAGRSQLYSSADGGRTWRPISIQLPPGSAWRARNIVPDPAHPHIVYVSIRSDAPPADLLARFGSLLDFSSEEAVAALKLVDAHDAAPQAVSWGKGVDGVYVTQDGGSLWRKTGLAVDAWLAFEGGALWAAAADPILEAAALVRRYPDLAGAADRQLKGGGVTPAVLREACRFPGRDALLKGPMAATLSWRSTDSGATWSKLDDLPLSAALALRPKVGDSGTPYATPRANSAGSARPLRIVSPDLAQTRYGGRGLPRHPPGEQVQQGPQRALSPELLLAFVDPIRLVARFNFGLPVSGVTDGAAYAATQPYWDALVKALADESQDEHEISLGPGRPAWTGGPAYELLQREGDAWTAVPGEPPPAFPRSIAPGIFLVGSNGRAWAIRRK